MSPSQGSAAFLAPCSPPNRRISPLVRSFPATSSVQRTFIQTQSLISAPLPTKPLARRSLATAATPAKKDMATTTPFKPAKVIDVTVEGPYDAAAWKGDLVVIGVFEESIEKDDKKAIKDAELLAFDGALGGAITDILAEDMEFKAKVGASATLRTGAGGAKSVTLVGLGPKAKALEAPMWGPAVLQKLGENAAAAAKTAKAKTIAVTMLGAASLTEADRAAAAGRIAGGLYAGSYEDLRFKSKQTPTIKLERAHICVGAAVGAAEAVSTAKALQIGAMMTRHLVNAPPNVCTPTHLAECAKAIAAESDGCMTLQVLERAQCEALNMGLYLGVSEASAEPPKFIHLTYKPAGDVKKKLALVGKGLTFDSGGYNLKAGPGSMIEMMKFDMGGSAAVLGAASALAALKPAKVEVHFIVAACENMVDAKAMRPGDILTASNGKTVEINNTDAEGRLTLADALVYAEKNCGAETIIDIATLTGAIMVGLGTNVAGFYSYKDSMADAITAASRRAGEKMWRMPLEEPYFDSMKSQCADMKNAGSRFGGSISAALFLKEYVSTDKVEWAHMDIAGPVWSETSGATGYGAMTLAEFVMGTSKAL